MVDSSCEVASRNERGMRSAQLHPVLLLHTLLPTISRKEESSRPAHSLHISQRDHKWRTKCRSIGAHAIKTHVREHLLRGGCVHLHAFAFALPLRQHAQQNTVGAEHE